MQAVPLAADGAGVSGGGERAGGVAGQVQAPLEGDGVMGKLIEWAIALGLAWGLVYGLAVLLGAVR